MPEMPEVQGLTTFLDGRAVGRTITRTSAGAIAALKTYDPPITALHDETITAAARLGKFVVLSCGDNLHLVFHLAKAGWLRWYETLPTTLIRPGKSPIALRVALDDGSGFDLTEAGTKKSLAVYVVRDPQAVPGIARLGPARPRVHARRLRRAARGSPHADQGPAARPGRDRGHRQCLL